MLALFSIGIAAGSFASSALQGRLGLAALGWPAAAVALVGLLTNVALLRLRGGVPSAGEN